MFTFAAAEGYMIRNGEIAEPVCYLLQQEIYLGFALTSLMGEARSQESGDRRQEESGMSEKPVGRIIPQFICPNLAVNTNFLRLFNSKRAHFFQT
ncbi:hypothetical protein ACP6PL_14180 [Dapis sp. BLCC M126]|uniref:hypothetical protein n=1 Tax=Dapis sp. BLCC M126 TaxID=3400189 RepID=UPI003CECB80B